MEDRPRDSDSFAEVARRKVFDVPGGTVQDVAGGQIKEAATQIVELGRKPGPWPVNSANRQRSVCLGS